MIVLAVVLLFLLLIALIPVGVCVQYDDGKVILRAAAGPVQVTLYPPKQKNCRKEARKQKKLQKKREKLRQKPKKTTQPAAARQKLTASALKPWIQMGLDLIRGLPRKLLVRDLTIRVTFGGRDAAQAAIGYGRAWAVIGAVIPVLENTFRIRNREIDAQLDYGQESVKLFLRLDIRMRIGTGLLLGLRAGIQVLQIILQNKKKAVQINESSSV